MKRIHFIAIGGAAMHNLALELNAKGYIVTGSDDEIAEPSRSRLKAAGLLPDKMGWDAGRISEDIHAVILGMHARKDNPELLKSQELNLKIYSYPEFLFEQTKNKKRVVIAGSHGKTTVTSMVMHVFKENNVVFDYMVGAKIEGYDTMVTLDSNSNLAVFEGDEYLSSPLDLRPKFIHYKPHIALINGIAWDHINVFPTFENYKEQFKKLIQITEKNGTVIYNKRDSVVCELINKSERKDLTYIPFEGHNYKQNPDKTFLITSDNKEIPVLIFGEHNMFNISAAKVICEHCGIHERDFYQAIGSFTGSAKRLQNLYDSDDLKVFLDFAHAPSKLKATLEAVKSKFNFFKIYAIFELHTFSSLNKEFLKGYSGTMQAADRAIVYFNPDVVAHKKLEPISKKDVELAFGSENVLVINYISDLENAIPNRLKDERAIFLFMSSGNFGGKTSDELINMCI